MGCPGGWWGHRHSSVQGAPGCGTWGRGFGLWHLGTWIWGGFGGGDGWARLTPCCSVDAGPGAVRQRHRHHLHPVGEEV